MAKITYQKVVTFEEGDKVNVKGVDLTLIDLYFQDGVFFGFTDQYGNDNWVYVDDIALVESADGRVPDDIDPHKRATDQAYANGYREAVDLYAGDIY